MGIEPEGSSAGSSPFQAWKPADDGLSDPYVDLVGLARQRAEAARGLVAERPALIAAGGAVLVGALAGYLIAGRRRHRTPVEAIQEPLRETGRAARGASKRAARLLGKRTGRLAYYGELATLAYKLWENPLIRAFITQYLVRRVARRLS